MLESLQEIKNTYQTLAQQYNGWEKADKNDLCREYVRATSARERDVLFSCIILRYWSALYRYKLQSPYVSDDECYNWLIRALLYVLTHHRWDDKDSTIYNDPNGPDKAINRCIFSSRLMFYEKSNSIKRTGQFNTVDIDDKTISNTLEDDTVFKSTDSVWWLIYNEFNKGNYFTSFMIYNILYNYPFDVIIESGKKVSVLNKKKLLHLMHTINDNLIESFAEDFDIDINSVRVGAEFCNTLSTHKIRISIIRNIKILQKSNYFGRL